MATFGDETISTILTEELERSEFMDDPAFHNDNLQGLLNTPSGSPSQPEPVDLEELKSLYQELQTIPTCAERSIIELLCCTYSKRISDKEILSQFPNMPQLSDKDIEEKLKTLEEQLQKEELYLVNGTKLIIRSSTLAKNKDWIPMSKSLKQLLRETRPVSFQEIFRLVEKSKIAAETVKDRDIIIFLGDTGAGKSTTILFLAGSKMGKTKVNGLNHIAPTGAQKDSLRCITTSPLGKSETRYISCVEVDPKTIKANFDEPIILCDSAGFGDTAGAEVDIANGYGVINAIKSCKSVKPVILISYKSIGDRLTGLKNLAHLLVGMIRDIKDHTKTFSYFFTKYPEEERAGIHASLKDAKDQMTPAEKEDKGLNHLITDMVRRTMRKPATTIDPIKDDPGEIMDDLVMDTLSIERPGEVFRFSLTEKSKTSLQEQIRKHQSSITKATNRYDYPLVQYKLQELKQMYELLKQDSINQSYTECIKALSKKLNNDYGSCVSTFDCFLGDQNELNKETVVQYAEMIRHAQDAENLRISYLEADVVSSGAYIQHLQQEATSLASRISLHEVDSASAQRCLDKLKLLSGTFAELGAQYKNACQTVLKTIDQLVEKFMALVSADEFEKSAREIQKISRCREKLSNHLNQDTLETKYQEGRSCLLNLVEGFIGQTESVFQQEKLTEKDVEVLKKCFSRIEAIKGTSGLLSHISSEAIESVYSSLLEKIVACFDGINSKINEEFQLHKENSISALEQLTNEMILIRTIPVVENKTAQSYHSTLEMLCGFITELGREVDHILGQQQKENIDYSRLHRCLVGLKGARWLETLRPAVYADVIKDVDERVLQHAHQLELAFKEATFSFDDFANLQTAQRILRQVTAMESLQRIVPTLGSIIESVVSLFNERSECLFKDVSGSLEKWRQNGYRSFDKNKAEKMLNYLTACTTVNCLMKEAIPLLNNLQDLVRDYRRHVDDHMKRCYNNALTCDSNKRAELYANSEKLADSWKGVIKLREKCPTVYGVFDSEQTMLEEWAKKISKESKNLEDEMEDLCVAKKNQALNDKITIAKSLSQLDEIIGNPIYNDIFRRYQQKFNQDVPDVLKKGTKAIEDQDYSSVFSHISELEELKKAKVLLAEVHTEQLNKALNDSIEELIEQTKNKARLALIKENVTLEKMTPVAQNLKKIQSAKTYVSQYLNDVTAIDQQLKEIKSTLKEGLLEQLNGIKTLINSYNFSQVDAKKTNIRLICDVLGTHCDPVIFEEMRSLEKMQANKLDSLASTYENLSIKEYFRKPPKDILDKLAKVKDGNSKCEEAVNKIEEDIIAMFRSQLEEAKSDELTDVANPYLRMFESALIYVPDNLKEFLRLELRDCTEDIRQNIAAHSGEVEKTMQSQDPRRIKAALDKCKKLGMHDQFRKTVSTIFTQVQTIKAQVDSMIEQGEISKISSNLKRLYEYKLHLGSIVEEIVQPYSEIHSYLSRSFREAYSSMINGFVNFSSLTVTKEAVVRIEESFSCLLEFSSLRENLKDHAALDDMLQKDFATRIEQVDAKVSGYLKDHHKKYEEAVHVMDIPSLKVVLNSMRNLDPFFTNVKRSMAKYVGSDIPFGSAIEALNQVKSYPEMAQTFSTNVKRMRDEVIGQEILKDHSLGQKKREEFYTEINLKLSVLLNLDELSSHLKDPNLASTGRECVDFLENTLKSGSSEAGAILEKPALTRIDADAFNNLYGNLSSFAKIVKVHVFQGARDLVKIDQKVMTKTQDLVQKALENRDVEHLKRHLIDMKTLSDYLFDFKKKIDEKIDEVLLSYRTQNGGARAIAQLGTLLNKDPSGVGASIISEHGCFQGYALSLFNTRTQKHGLDYVLDHLDGDLVDKELLKKRYQEFDEIYKALIKRYLEPNPKLAELISETQLVAGGVKQSLSEINWDATVRVKIPKLMAHIFALWTITNSEHFFEAENVDDRDNYLLQPHAAQIISIFRMLGVGDKKEELMNNLVQIGTGEGKSVTLAVTACVLTLLGFDVDCACYSEYLSQRDYTAFKSLFDSLNVQNYIHYGTFNKLCEGIINQDGEVRKLLADTILNNGANANAAGQSEKRPKILLIDEVDVFFSKDFYGNLYTPASTLKDPTITALIDSIWNKRHSAPNLTAVKNTPEFQACCQRFSQWAPLIEEAVKDMLFDVVHFQSHDYIVSNDKIGYKEQDNVVYNAVYGYKTLFAYYLEHEKGAITAESLDRQKSIGVKCGSFSYAEIPLLFKYIMGVTGTLKTLSDPEKKVIQEVYKIKKSTYSPSVFGANQLKFNEKEDIFIENVNDYYNVIVREICDRIQGKLPDTKRAVMAFFESDKKLMDFYNSPAAAAIKDQTIILTEETKPEEKDAIIRRATTSGQISLLTRCFGRGTDFVCRDQIVSTNGGLHVIQTFLSEELSEEVQIKGRTARQGENGSYSMVLLDSSLEKFLITKENLQEGTKGGWFTLFKSTSEYDFINKKRIDLFKTQYEDNSKFLAQIKKHHDEAIQFLQNLCSNKIEDVKTFLFAQNRGVTTCSSSRIIILMDATGSMTNLLHKAKTTVGTMFDRAYEILKENNIGQDSFQLQFVVYRNYNSSAEKLLMSSPWETKPENLRAFMEKINPEGGWGNEAVEMGLWHANLEHAKEKVSQVILIGDAPANSEAEVTNKRALKGESYWTTTKFANKTFYKTELQKLKDSNVPVHGLFVAKYAEVNFREIAASSNGRCQELDINSKAGADMLADLVTEEILRSVGQANGKGDALVDAYRAKFGKSYT